MALPLIFEECWDADANRWKGDKEDWPTLAQGYKEFDREIRSVAFDRKTGLMTALMRFAPGATLPDHEHVNIEQTYVLEGSLVDKEGPAEGIECNAGEFIWREAGSRHVAWCPQGGLMLAIFQVPNKFFFEWLEEHYVQLLKKSIRQELGERGRLLYHIPEQGVQEPVKGGAAKMDTKPSSDKDNAPVPGVFDAEMIKNPFIIPGIKRIKVDPQLNPNYVFDNFIEGDCNRLARNAGLAIAKKPGGTAFNPLVVFGDVGLGKTIEAGLVVQELILRHRARTGQYARPFEGDRPSFVFAVPSAPSLLTANPCSSTPNHEQIR